MRERFFVEDKTKQPNRLCDAISLFFFQVLWDRKQSGLTMEPANKTLCQTWENLSFKVFIQTKNQSLGLSVQ